MELLTRHDILKHTERVLQFGEGNFLRGFVDWMFDRLNKENDGDFGVVVVQPRPGDKVSKLNAQGGLYTLYSRGLVQGKRVEERRIVSCITRGIDPYKNPGEFFACAQNPDLRFIVSNTTEAGIEYRKEKEDFAGTTFPGRLAMFLKARYDAGLEGFLILPCELIENNGECLKECVLRYAFDWKYGKEFRNWLERENHFMNTLVDRIVSGYPQEDAQEMERQLGYADRLMDTAEMYHLWVIEGERKYAEELPFHKIGLNVLWTDNVKIYKQRKVSILNGAHTVMAMPGILSGIKTVREAMKDATICSFVKKAVYEEIIPVIALPEQELIAFAEEVMNRFKNPFIHHSLTSIALNSVAKFKERVLPNILKYRAEYGTEPDCLVCSLAALILYYKAGEAEDDKEIFSFINTASVPEILARTDYWGTSLLFLQKTVERYIHIAENGGIREAVRTAIAGGTESNSSQRGLPECFKE